MWLRGIQEMPGVGNRGLSGLLQAVGASLTHYRPESALGQGMCWEVLLIRPLESPTCPGPHQSPAGGADVGAALPGL